MYDSYSSDKAANQPKLNTKERRNNMNDDYDGYDEERAYLDKGAELDFIAQEKHELEAFESSLEGRLIGFTDQELLDEYYRRLFEPYNKSLEQMRDTLDNLTPPF